MSSRRTSHRAAHRTVLVVVLATIGSLAACADDPLGPQRDGTPGTLEALTPRLDDGATTRTSWCGHSQGWDC